MTHHSSTINDQLSAIRAQFVDSLDERALHLDRSLETLVQNTGVMADVLDDIRMAVHKIAGVAGTLGFQNLGALAATCEKTIVDGPMPENTQTLITQINALLDQMESIVVAAEAA